MSVSPLPFVSPRRRQLPRSGFLYLWFTLVFCPSSGFYFSLPPPVVLTFLCSLVLMTSEQEAAGPPASANATPQNWSFIDKSDVAASPRTTTKPLYIQCFLCSQAVQSPFKSFLFNLIVQAFFIFISSCSLGWTLARCGNRHFQMSFRWHFQVWASRLNLGKCSVENWKLFFFFFQCCFFFFSLNKDAKTSFPLPISAAVLLKWSHMNAYVTQYVNGGIRYSEALRETSAGRDVLCIPGSIYFFVSVFFLLPVK